MIVMPLFKKLNFKQHKEILVLNSPVEFGMEITEMHKCTTIKNDVKSISEIKFVLIFVKTQAEIETMIPLINEKLIADGIVWFAYPKGTSKKYKAEINRDKGWEILGKFDFEPVRQVSVDEDWSALRFRKVGFIKTMNRRKEFAMTEEGKAKITRPEK